MQRKKILFLSIAALVFAAVAFLTACDQIKPPAPKPKKGEGNPPMDIQAAVEKVAPGWKAAQCGPAMDPGLRPEWGGKKNVLMTHPLDRNTGCVLSKKIEAPAGKKTVLHLVVANDPRGDFDLIVRANGRELVRKTVAVNKGDTQNQWLTEDVDLSPQAGRKVNLELVNQPNGWSWEAAYWAEIDVKSE